MYIYVYVSFCMHGCICVYVISDSPPRPPLERHDSAVSNVINLASHSQTTQHIGQYWLVAIYTPAYI